MTLTVWHTQVGPAQAQLNAFARDVSQVYPWITVSAEAKTNDGDLMRQGIAAMALNQSPDLIIANTRTIAEFARRDALVDLDTFLGDPEVGLKGEDRGDFLPGALESGRFPDLGNRLFAFPFDEHAIVLYYNADNLRAAGIDSPPRTWDEFGAVARSTTRDGAHGWVMIPDASTFYAFLFSRGGDVLNETQTEVRFNSTAGLKSLQMITALNRGGSALLVENREVARADFAEGRATMMFGGTDELDGVAAAIARRGQPFAWGVANLPQENPDSTFTALDGANVGIFKSSPERERSAWLFARWLATPEASARWSTASLGIPLRLSARALLATNLPANLTAASIGNLADPLPALRGVPTVKDAGIIDQAIAEMWTAVANGTDPSAALSRAATRANRVLGQK